MLKRIQDDELGVRFCVTCPTPLRGRLGGGILPPAWTLGFASLPHPQPLPAGEGGKAA